MKLCKIARDSVFCDAQRQKKKNLAKNSYSIYLRGGERQRIEGRNCTLIETDLFDSTRLDISHTLARASTLAEHTPTRL